jgi:anti-sigma B factor antagonist
VSELATIEVEQVGGAPVARVAGEVDASNASLVQARILDGIGNASPGLVVDLSKTGYLDSAGIRALFGIGERLQVRGLELRIVAAPNSFIADVLATVRMSERFAVDDDMATAVAALGEHLPRERTTE